MDSELDDVELASLSAGDDTRELKAMELFLHTRETQKFAVRNLGERAAWIDALW
jgi:hypothetical protein